MSCTRQITLLSTCAMLHLLQGCGGSSSATSLPTQESDTPGGSVEQEQTPLNDAVSGDDALLSIVDLPTDNPPADVNPGPEGDSNLRYDAKSYPLDSGLGDIWGARDEHYKIAFTLTDGKFELSPTEVDGVTHNLLMPAQATAVFYAELYSPGSSFSFVTYSYSPFGAGGGVLAGNAFFDQAYVEVDVNNSGGIEPNERLAVTGGTVDFTGVLPDIELHFSVAVEDGQSVEGHYSGLFDFTNRD